MNPLYIGNHQGCKRDVAYQDRGARITRPRRSKTRLKTETFETETTSLLIYASYHWYFDHALTRCPPILQNCFRSSKPMVKVPRSPVLRIRGKKRLSERSVIHGRHTENMRGATTNSFQSRSRIANGSDLAWRWSIHSIQCSSWVSMKVVTLVILFFIN